MYHLGFSSMFAEGISWLTNLVSMAKADLLIQLRYLRITARETESVIGLLIDPSEAILRYREKSWINLLSLSERRSVSEGLDGYTPSSENIHTRQVQFRCPSRSCKKNRINNIQAPSMFIFSIHITISCLRTYPLNLIP